MNSLNVQQLIVSAQQGDGRAMGELLEHFRPYLRMLAQRQMDVRMQSRVGASDIVQQTFLEAQRDFSRFRGRSEGEVIAWLRQVLENNATEALRRHLAVQKRTANREKSMDDSGRGLGALRDFLPGDQSSPSQRVMRDEAAVRLSQAIEQLPEDQGEAIRLRHLEGWSLGQLAEHFGRSEVAVAGLVKRGLRGLRKYFDQQADQERSPEIM